MFVELWNRFRAWDQTPLDANDEDNGDDDNDIKYIDGLYARIKNHRSCFQKRHHGRHDYSWRERNHVRHAAPIELQEERTKRT